MKKTNYFVIVLVLFFLGCITEPAEPTGKSIAVNETEFNYPVALRNKAIELEKEKKIILTEKDLGFIKKGESIFIKINKRGLIDRYEFGYLVELEKNLKTGESVNGVWFHKNAEITFTEKNKVLIEQKKTIELKNFNQYEEITKERFNVELIKNNKEELTAIKIYNTQQIKLNEITELYS